MTFNQIAYCLSNFLYVIFFAIQYRL